MTTLRRLLVLVAGVAWLVTGLLIGASAPAGATDASGCTGDVVVAFDVKLLARPGEHRADVALATPLAPGEYVVMSVSADGYEGRAGVVQPHERWTLQFFAGDRSLGVVGPTTDLPDGVEHAVVVDDLGTVVVGDPVDRLRIRHGEEPVAGGTDSVRVVCVGLTRTALPGDSLVADASADCSAGDVVVSVSNPGPLAATAEVVVGGSGPARVAVAPNAAVDHRGPADGASTTVTVRSVPDGRVVVDTAVDTGCGSAPVPPPGLAPGPPPPPAPPPGSGPVAPRPPAVAPPPVVAPLPPAALTARASVDCTSSEAVVVLANTGLSGAVVDLAIPASAVAGGVEIAAGAITTTTLSIEPDLEDTITEVRVLDATSGELYTAVDLDINCLGEPAPAVGSVVDCGRGTLVVALTNDGAAPTELTVIHERTRALDPVVVAPGDEVHVELAVTGTELPLRVVDAGGDDIVREVVDTSCVVIDSADPGGDAGTGSDDTTGTGADGAAGPVGSDECSGASTDASGCKPVVHVAMLLECDEERARLEIGRFGEGRERVVVLADGVVIAVVEIDSQAPTVVDVPVNGTVEITVSRADAGELVTTRRVSCGGDGAAGVVAASLVVVAVLASAAGVLPWPARPGVAGAAPGG